MIAFIKRLLKIRIVRFGLVGSIGVPVNDLALFLFLQLFGMSLYPLASACAFEVSNIINFILNQLFTYSEQKLHGWEWVRRGVKGQLTSLSALLLSFLVAWSLVALLHVNPYVANPTGIFLAFIETRLLETPVLQPGDEKPRLCPVPSL